MADERREVLELVAKGESLASISSKTGIPAKRLLGLVESLSGAGLVDITREEKAVARLTEEGMSYLDEFPEERLRRDVEKDGSVELSKINNKIGLIWAKRNGWVTVEGGHAKLAEGKRQQGASTYAQREVLGKIHALGGADASEAIGKSRDVADILISRGLVTIGVEKSISDVRITDKGRKELESVEETGMLTREMIRYGDISKMRFKRYSVDSAVERAGGARLHPMHKMIRAIRDRWVGMGFKETYGPIIESSFWNFDALLSPQDHPTREMQDTFFLSNPKEIDIEDMVMLGRVRRMHKKAWKEKWSERLARQAVLRTHATSVSAHNISRYASFDSDYPIKLFSIGKIFRNESVDYKHLAELHQIDGIVIGNSLTLANLFDILKNFYSSFDIEVKFKPSYFPFTEPSVEMYYYDERFKDNIELGGGGIIRSEISKALGTKKTVLAWGLGVERLLFNYIRMEGLSDLYSNNVKWLKEANELVL